MADEMGKSVWCPGCSCYVDGICHQFHCAIGPHAMGAKTEENSHLLQQRIIQLDHHLRMAKLLSDLIREAALPSS